MIRRLLPRDDAGFSLMEVMVGSAIMATVMAVVTGGFLTMYRTTDRAEAGAMTQSALMASFARLDREIRYAYRVNGAYLTQGNAAYAVDYVIPDADNVRQCVQLSLPVAGGTLTRTVWPMLNDSMSVSGRASAVANDLAPATAGTNPFTVMVAGSDGTNFDRLRMTVNSTVGGGPQGASRGYNLLFTAQNTTNDPLVCTK